MKIKNLPLITGSLFVLVLSSFAAFYPTGAPPAKTGSPGDNSDCTTCHGGTATSVAGWITSNIPAGGYVPGQTYQVTASNQITGSGKFGFEVSPQNVAGTLLGTLAAGANSQLVGNNKYVTHTNATAGISSWTFNWTAPAAGTGLVTFYGAFAKGHPGPVRLSTLAVNEQVVVLPGNAGPITGPSVVCQNNSYSYSIAAITGATSYVWTVPAGVNITSGQGTTIITADFGAYAVSGPVSVYGSNTAGNGAPGNLPVTVNSLPAQPTTIAGQSAPCAGSSETYSVTNLSGVTYTWTVPVGSTIYTGQGTSSITVIIGGNNGSIQVVPANSCGDGPMSSLAINVGTIPGVAATPIGPDLVDLQFTARSNYSTTGSGGVSSCLWEIMPVLAGTITGTGLTAMVNWGSYLGNAEIRVKYQNSCGEGAWSTIKQTQVINTTGINEVNNQPGINVFPNPGNGHFTLELNGNSEYSILRILDASGKERYKNQINGNGTTVLDLPFESGMYLILVSDGIKTLKQKLFIQ